MLPIIGHVTVFNTIVSIVLAAAALVTVWFAWKASQESRQAAELGRQTVLAVRAAHEADERDRRLRQLREIGNLVEDVLKRARAQQGVEASSIAPRQMQWTVREQGVLAQALAAYGDMLPACRDLSEEAGAAGIAMLAEQASEEVRYAISDVREESG